MPQIIKTKYIPATNTKPMRIKATHTGKTVSITKSAWDSIFQNANSDTDHHKILAQLLMKELGWKGEMVGGHDNEGMVWVFRNENQLPNNKYPTVIEN